MVIRLAVVNDYDVICAGVARLLAPFADRVQVIAPISIPRSPTDPAAASRLVAAASSGADVLLQDPFLHEDGEWLAGLLAASGPGRLLRFVWAPVTLPDPGLETTGRVSKTSTAAQLLAAVESSHRGEVVRAAHQRAMGDTESWSGLEEGLTRRESEVVALIALGLTNEEVATACRVSMNSVKTHVRSAYRKIGVERRVEAVIWAHRHGFPGQTPGVQAGSTNPRT